jgi:asparagine synthase (glutamine-hydrolysing)
VSALARRDVAVVLTGDGGDEQFMGYARYALAPTTWSTISRIPARGVLRRVIESSPTAVLHAAALVMRPFIPAGFSRENLPEKLRRAASLLRSRSLTDVYDFYMSIWHDPTGMMIDRSVRLQPMSYDEAPSFDAEMERMAWWDGVHHLPDDLLVKVDRATMASSLEGRMPFLDRRLAELAWRLPVGLKYRDGQGKWVLKQVRRKYLPADDAERPKRGFAVPLERWLKGPLASWAGDLLSESRLRRQGILDASAASAAWREFRRSPRYASSQVWSLLMLQSWLEARGR